MTDFVVEVVLHDFYRGISLLVAGGPFLWRPWLDKESPLKHTFDGRQVITWNGIVCECDGRMVLTGESEITQIMNRVASMHQSIPIDKAESDERG